MKLTPIHKSNEREVEMMVGKAMCAYANAQQHLGKLYSANTDEYRTLCRQNAVAFNSEYEATVRILDMFVKENIYRIQRVVTQQADEMMGE